MSLRRQQNKTVYYTHNENPDLPVIIMIHGFRGTHHGLDLIATPLIDHQVIVPDLPGFGESDPLMDEHSVNNYVRWLADFITGLNLPTLPILLGHSFGSVIAANYAVKYPNTIYKLILINPIGSPALKGPKAITTQLTQIYYWIASKLPEKTAYRLLTAKSIFPVVQKSIIKTRDKKILEYIYSQHLAHSGSFASRKVVFEALDASIKHTVREVAHEIKVPTLIIAGELDDITPLAKQHELKQIIPNAEMTIINGVGHLTQYETPDAVADAIKKFAN